MKKLLILLKGGSRNQRPSRVGEFTLMQGRTELVWKGRALELDEFNEQSDLVFGRQKLFILPQNYYIAVEVVSPESEALDTEYLGEDLLPELELKEGETKQDVLKAICGETYGGSINDWNRLADKHKRNLISKAFEFEAKPVEEDTPPAPPVEPVTAPATDKALSEELQEDDLSNIGEQPAEEEEAATPEVATETESEETYQGFTIEEVKADLASDMHWKSFEKKYGKREAEVMEDLEIEETE